MEASLAPALWFGWAFACALGIRVGFTRLFRSKLGTMAQFAAYGMWLVFLLIGFVLIGLSGMQMYGFDASDPRQLMGYWVLRYSPMGLPTAYGAPAVLLVDVAVATIALIRRLRAIAVR